MSSNADDVKVLVGFRLLRVLNEDPKQKSAILLGTLPGEETEEQAILILEKTHFSERFYSNLSSIDASTHTEQERPEAKTSDVLARVKNLGQNDIYTWLLAWTVDSYDGSEGDADIKLTLIHPATQTHIDKYSAQDMFMVIETPDIYATKVLPWIESIPSSRIQWVYNILEHKKEADTILYENPDPHSGFIIVPDLKWDQKTTSSLYIQAIVHDRSLRSLRDLTTEHVDLLLSIRQQASEIAFTKYGLQGSVPGTSEGNVRCFIHYQPSYYHLHVHILAARYTSHPGAIVGQAHLLDDVIDLLKLGVDFRQRTLIYALGTNSKLWSILFA